ncbi:MAG TPA: translation elongation factor Ts, partial [Kofleriaceae bacterium]|nr:translation elongation factor Ts [Kofleriaceae bacterium]
MAEVTATLIKDLRERTGAGMADCKKALTEVGGDMDKAIDYLRTKGLAKAAKKAGREATEGAVVSYIHGGGRIGVLVEVNCETDFVARNEDFQGFTREVALQIAAMNPQFVRREEVSQDVIDREREVLVAKAKETGKPDAVVQKMVDGQITKWLKEICLLDQA